MSVGLKIVTIGGGSSYTPELVEGFIKRYDELPVSELWLVDVEEGKHKLETVGALAKRMVKKSGLPIEVHTTLNRREALPNADFVTTQFRVGLLDAREKDERIPLEHGVIGQETNGAGGMFKAFRTIPVMLDIGADIKELCPDAWLINFTNPSGMVTEAMIKYSGLTKVVGLCNVPIHMEMNVAQWLDVDHSRVRIHFAGLNHLVYGLNVYLDGKDITGEVLDFLTDEEKRAAMSMKNVIPVEYDKHFVKGLGLLVCPYHNYYYKTDTMLESELKEFKENNVRAQAVKKIEDELFKVYEDEGLDIKPPQLEQRGGAYYSDAACRLISSIYNDKKDIQPVDTRNNGAIWGLEDDAAVEVSCIITKDGPVPLNIGKLPVAAHGLVQTLKAFEVLTIEAAVEGNYDKALLALTINPLIPSDTVAKTILDKLLEEHKDYLPRFFK